MKKIFTKKNSKHTTFDKSKESNGYLVPIYNVNDLNNPSDYAPKQVYLTVIQKDKIKGPHLHYKRDGFFTCIKGDVKIIIFINDDYVEYKSGESHNYLSVFIPKGTPAAIQNIGSEEAFLINMPSPAWTPEMNDEHSPIFENYDFKK